jgi:hypothetical protein
MAFKSNSLFPVSTTPYVSAPPGVNATKNPPGSVKLPSPPKAGVARLARALAKLPSGSGARGNASQLFLP